ncbi:MAG: hypothetical protein MR743_03780 [Oscillospiraceae bacterium]|nr:hypothetical protein [Oscillospiraceae bacterium]
MPTTYICKCGRIVTKSTNADNTGNRNTDGCEGCPYLLPWGPMVWDERQKAYTQDVKGQECRMSPIIEYATAYYGRAEDKCSLHIVSLDLDFLDAVQAWIYDHANETLRADFSRGSMRGIEFSDKGRYSLSVLCAQNKKGVAAKAALLTEFFGPDKRRLDMTPEQEKAHILAAIEAGKARAQRKEKTMIYKDPVNGWMYRVSPKAGKDGCFCIEYIDPVSSAVWKPWPTEAKTRATSSETIAEVLEARVKQNGWEPVEEKEWNKPKTAPSGAAAVTTDGSAAAKCGDPDAETTTTPADASGAQLPQPLAQSAPRQTEHATDTAPAAPSAPVFDYSGLDTGTAERLQNLARRALEAKQRYVLDLMEIVVEAHRELCGSVVARCDNGTFGKKDDTFRAWCVSIGVSKDTAYRLLQVQSLMDGSTPEEQEVLAEAPANLLYAAAKPSAPAEAVQAVKNGDITTHKQYQELLAEVRARDAKIEELLDMSEAADRRADEARAQAKKAQQEAALDRKEREDAHEKAMHYKAECDRRAQEQQRVEGLLSTREEQLRQAQQAAQDAARTIQRKQEAIEELDEIARDRLEQIEALEKGRTIEAQVSDPEEVRRQAEALARELAAAETAGLQEENRLLRSCAPAVRQAWCVVTTAMDVILEEAEKAEAEDENGLNALEACEEQLLAWWSRVSDITNRLNCGEEYGHDEN